jgi:hypothetical protein
MSTTSGSIPKFHLSPRPKIMLRMCPRFLTLILSEEELFQKKQEFTFATVEITLLVEYGKSCVCYYETSSDA